ncbi:hypothetical protein [Fulvivirga ligni]|uniref:hypothetical protein n=1 Tax=Fulvivirga ligni TaxID=2904246 RepID=UPI001F36153E|nr:hypothetical protein [Fulvivirga ligni]UII21541.1 hypothetical protein LVD16_27310 [Fulvivirga ligni]
MGGTIAWKYDLARGNVDRLVCVSSTRLRYEKLRPAGEVTLYYGQADPFKPTDQWLNAMKLESFFMAGMGHELFKDEGGSWSGSESIDPHFNVITLNKNSIFQFELFRKYIILSA